MQNSELLPFVIDDLRRRFGEVYSVGLLDAAMVLGFAKGTAYRKSSEGSFPVPVLRCAGSSPRISIFQLAQHLANAGGQEKVVAVKKGRPSAVEVRSAKRRGLTVMQARALEKEADK